MNPRYRNPNWTRDELILALDLYFQVSPLTTSETDPRIVGLSALLNALPIHPRGSHNESFRNPNGVYMKMCNFLRLDPSYTGTGLKAGAKGDEEVWAEFADDRTRLTSIARAIRAFAAPGTGLAASDSADAEEIEAPEGRILSRVHLFRERNRDLARKKKAAALQDAGCLKCEVCGFDFSQRYGKLGEGFIECHHTTPLSALAPDGRTKLTDLALVCSNCHRMLHRGKPWPSMQALTASLKHAV